jgi:Zn finger protein HypA/HybF involved in hydrogenase expression
VTALPVINLARWRKKNSPHSTGKAKCLTCHHEWVAVAPLGTVWLRCPKCRTRKGTWKNHFERAGKEWRCHCGAGLFVIMPEGVYCPNCGDWQKGF